MEGREEGRKEGGREGKRWDWMRVHEGRGIRRVNGDYPGGRL